MWGRSKGIYIKGRFQSLLQSGRSKAAVTAASIKMQEKLDRTDPFNFGSSQDTKRFISLLLQTCHGIFHPPSKTSELPLDAKQKYTISNCPVPPSRVWGWRPGWLGTECHLPRHRALSFLPGLCTAWHQFAPKSQVKIPSALTDFVSSPKDCISPFPLG